MKDVVSISITRKTKLREALAILDRTGLGILLLLDDYARFERTVTDGDLRRLVLAGVQLDDAVDSKAFILRPFGLPLLAAKRLM